MPAHTHLNGDRAEYVGTSEVLHGGLFYHVRMTEGRFAGQTRVTQRSPDGVIPAREQVKRDWREHQDAMARLNPIKAAN